MVGALGHVADKQAGRCVEVLAIEAETAVADVAGKLVYRFEACRTFVVDAHIFEVALGNDSKLHANTFAQCEVVGLNPLAVVLLRVLVFR